MVTEEHAICIVGPLDASRSAGSQCSGKHEEGPLDTLVSAAAAKEARQIIQRCISSCSALPGPVLLSQDSDFSSFTCASAPARAVHTCNSQQHLQDTVAAGLHSSSSPQPQQCLQEAGAVVENAAPEQPKQKRHHRHKHRHRHHHMGEQQHLQQQEQQPILQHGFVERSISACALHSPTAGHCSRSSSPNLVAMVEERRPKSFTLGQHYRPPTQSVSHSAPGNSLVQHNGSHTPPGTRPRQAHLSKLLHQQHVHIVATGRRSPLQMALLSKHAGFGSYGCATDGSFTGPPAAIVPKPERIMSESLKPKIIAKGFAGHWLSRRSIDVFTGSRAAAAAVVLHSVLPRCPGLHLWLVKPPRSRCWVPIHLGAVDNLQSVGEQYLHDDGSCGPAAEPFKYKVFMDLMCRGFAVQLRFRPLKSGAASVADDLLAKLRLFDFPLNDKDNGGCRPIELPNGWQVTEYPVMVDWVNALYEARFGPRRIM